MLLTSELNGWCCNKGKYILPSLPPLPYEFTQLIEQSNGEFNKLARVINNLYAFTAIGTTDSFIQFHGPANVAVTGRIYYRILDLSKPTHSFYWFLFDGTGRATHARQYAVPDDTLMLLTRLFTEINPYIKLLKHTTETINTESPPFTIVLDTRHTIQPTEIAAIINPYNLTDIQPRQIIIYFKGTEQGQFINILSLLYEPLQYPLLFPHGTYGWSPQLDKHTQCNYYRYRLLTEPRFRLLGHLTCEYLVDMYSRVEEERLNYIHQGRNSQYNTSDSELGFQNTLPISFLGSRAWVSEQVSDALPLVRQFGKPTFFITMTANPQWPEIISQLQPHQTASNIPEVVCRTFKARLDFLLKILRQYFGSITYIVRVIEFQKRGLPYCHMVVKVFNFFFLSKAILN